MLIKIFKLSEKKQKMLMNQAIPYLRINVYHPFLTWYKKIIQYNHVVLFWYYFVNFFLMVICMVTDNLIIPWQCFNHSFVLLSHHSEYPSKCINVNRISISSLLSNVYKTVTIIPSIMILPYSIFHFYLFDWKGGSIFALNTFQ